MPAVPGQSAFILQSLRGCRVPSTTTVFPLVQNFAAPFENWTPLALGVRVSTYCLFWSLLVMVAVVGVSESYEIWNAPPFAQL